MGTTTKKCSRILQVLSRSSEKEFSRKNIKFLRKNIPENME